MKRLSILWLIFVSISFSRAVDKKVAMNLDDTQLGVPQIAGVLPGATLQGDIVTQTWNLGASAAFVRTFRITADFKDVKDQLVLTYPQDVLVSAGSPRPTNYTAKDDWGSLGGVKTFDFFVPARSAPKITIQITGDSDKNSWPAGQTIRRVGWTYTLTEIDAVQGESVALAKVTFDKAKKDDKFNDLNRPWRVSMGENIGAKGIVRFENRPVSSQAFTKLYNFNVPDGIGCLRVVYFSDKKSMLTLRRGSAPEIGKKYEQGGVSDAANTSVRKTIIFPRPVSGKWYLYVSSAQDLSGKYELTIDCLQGGTWDAATSSPGLRNGQIERIAVGIEKSSSELITMPNSGAITLISHGRTDSPAGAEDDSKKMKNLGAAAAKKWNRVAYQVNWSEGSYWNTLGGAEFNGPRFIKNSAEKLGFMIGGNVAVDFLGHSWGTFMGNEISLKRGKFRRFFALDPAREITANTLSNYDSVINFSQDADYSLALIDASAIATLGDDDLAKKATDVGLIHSGHLIDSIAAHREPVLFMTHLLTTTDFTAVPFSFCIDDASGPNFGSRTWLKGGNERLGFSLNYGGATNTPILTHGYTVDIHTDGVGKSDQVLFRFPPINGTGDDGLNFKVFECVPTGCGALLP